MLDKSQRFIIAFLGLSLMLIVPTAQGKKLFRWYDNEGNVFFSDKVPPEHAKHKRESLTDTARVIKKETIEAAKSKEQIELEFRLETLRKKQKKIIEKQHAHDRVLKSTFRSVEDMELALARKTKSFEIQQRSVENNMNRLKDELIKTQKTAANYERNGKKVPKKTLNLINRTEQEISQTKANISSLQNRKSTMLKDFNADIERFKFLTKTDAKDATVIDESAEIEAANTLGLYHCNTSEECLKAWNLAKQFVKNHSNTTIELETDELIMTNAPVKDQDLSLSLSKLTGRNKKPQIFLDIRCSKSTLGRAICAGPKIQQLRSSFRPFIVSKLTVQ